MLSTIYKCIACIRKLCYFATRNCWCEWSVQARKIERSNAISIWINCTRKNVPCRRIFRHCSYSKRPECLIQKINPRPLKWKQRLHAAFSTVILDTCTHALYDTNPWYRSGIAFQSLIKIFNVPLQHSLKFSVTKWKCRWLSSKGCKVRTGPSHISPSSCPPTFAAPLWMYDAT